MRDPKIKLTEPNDLIHPFPMDTLEDAVLEYIEQGRSMIPIAKGTKKPPKDFKWKQFQTRYATPEEVAGWFKENPDAQIAMVTGAISGVAVVDGDSKKALGWMKENLPRTTVYQKTCDGYHALYKTNGRKVKNKSTNDYPPVHVRGDRGYILIAPSIHPSGQRYEFVYPIEGEGWDELAEFPHELFNQKPTEPTHKESATQSTFFDDVSGDKSHDALLKYAGRLIAKGITREEALEIGKDIIRARVRADKQEKRLGELPGMIDTAVKKYAPNESFQRGFTFKKVGDLEITPPDYVVQDLVEADSIVEIFGDPGTGKSFAGIDLACCTASGRDFHGHETKMGATCYIAGEGQNGLARRFAAWSIRNNVDLKTLPLFISMMPAALCDEDHAKLVLNAVDDIAEQYGPPQLIVIDTLARNFGPGDENSTKDMGAFIQTVDALRCAHKATILLIHHTGHANKERASGAMALTGALDAHYRMDKDKLDIIRFEAIKMKEAPFPEPMAFKIRSVELGVLDKDGAPVTSAILDEAEYEPRAEAQKPQGKWQEIGIEALNDLMRLEREKMERSNLIPDTVRIPLDDWKNECKYREMDRRRFYEIKNALCTRGEIAIEHGFVIAT